MIRNLIRYLTAHPLPPSLFRVTLRHVVTGEMETRCVEAYCRAEAAKTASMRYMRDFDVHHVETFP